MIGPSPFVSPIAFCLRHYRHLLDSKNKAGECRPREVVSGGRDGSGKAREKA